MTATMRKAIHRVEQGYVADAVIRAGIRRMCRKRLRDIGADDREAAVLAGEAFVSAMSTADIAPLPHLANEQHYEVPAEFFGLSLGPLRKYSCAWRPGSTPDLAAAERQALAATCEHAALGDGQSILELGCGWGSPTVWMAEHYPNSSVTAVSNSHSQRAWIVGEARRRGLRNVNVITADMNAFDPRGRFDRVVSVEMFEHMRNWRALFSRIHDWMSPGGRFFMHVFCHRAVPYEFVDEGPDDWMGRHFFSGGMMPSDDHIAQPACARHRARASGRPRR